MSVLPYVKVHYENGALGATSASPDGLLGLIGSATAVADTFELNKPYLITKYDDLGTLGVTAENNAAIEKLVREFYAETGSGADAYLMGVAPTVSMTDVLDYTNVSGARKLIEVSKGAIRGIIVSHTPAEGYEPVIADGMNADVYTAIAKGQELGDWAANTKFAPIFVVIEGRDYQGDPTELRDLTTQTDNRVAVLIGDTVAGTNGACVGLYAGRIAKNAVHISSGRVKDGSIASLTMFIADEAAGLANAGALCAKGFVTFRTHVGRAGYFISDDNLATLPTDDYKFLPYRRTVDKAYRIAYDTLLDEVLNEIPLMSGGKMQPGYAKNLENVVVRAISTQMTELGELSADPADPNDRGVICTVDLDQNVASTGRIEVLVRIRPYGYARYIDVYLGFEVVS